LSSLVLSAGKVEFIKEYFASDPEATHEDIKQAWEEELRERERERQERKDERERQERKDELDRQERERERKDARQERKDEREVELEKLRILQQGFLPCPCLICPAHVRIYRHI
jgi:hypothetical protein